MSELLSVWQRKVGIAGLSRFREAKRKTGQKKDKPRCELHHKNLLTIIGLRPLVLHMQEQFAG
ncbi:MAG: hypothetical protein WBN40_09150 [Pseudomonadales bacterium]